jgi:integrase
MAAAIEDASTRKVGRTKRCVDVRALPSPAAMAEAIDAIVTQQPASKTYRVMTAVAYFAGSRPSEVVMLRVRSAELPTEGWGRLDVTEADISFDEPGEPKTGPRSVPIPPVLVAMLREWVHQNDLTSGDQLLFRTRNDTRPSGSNWARAWHRALESVGQKPLRVYDCRHAAATTWLRAGMPLAEKRDDWDTASKHSCPPTSAPSMTRNTSPTDASTRSSNSSALTKLPRTRAAQLSRRWRSPQLREAGRPFVVDVTAWMGR